MIETTLSSLLSNYIMALLAGVGFIWLVGEWRRLRRARAERRFVIVCRLCQASFRDESAERLVACPSCQALNERRHPRSI
jgi:hypothetical protein